MVRLVDKTALVTGSTSGIGRAIARAMAAEGARVIVSGRDVARGHALVAEITAVGGRADFVAADFEAGSAGITELAGRTVQVADGRLDILVNNAAYLLGPIATTDTTPDVIDAALAVSVKAPLLLTATIVPAMVERGQGVIVNIGSINGLIGMPGAALYTATKHAIHGLTKAWAAEYGPAGVRVNTVAPGPTLTETVSTHRAYLEDLIAAIPSRQFSTPEQVAAAVVFLASDDAANIHGATLSVDGGWTTI